MAEVWFTSDTHFNHRAMIERKWRPFSSVEEMNEHIVDEWNRTVHKKDQVWHLGDFAMGDDVLAREFVGRLAGDKHLICGNHDKAWSGNRNGHNFQKAWIDAGFTSVQGFTRRRVNGRTAFLSHFPWFGAGDHTDTDRFGEYRLQRPVSGGFLIHGHVHEAWRTNENMFNVGVDVNDFRPVPLSVLLDYEREVNG